VLCWAFLLVAYTGPGPFTLGSSHAAAIGNRRRIVHLAETAGIAEIAKTVFRSLHPTREDHE
jgi:hypothetical protein